MAKDIFETIDDEISDQEVMKSVADGSNFDWKPRTSDKNVIDETHDPRNSL